MLARSFPMPEYFDLRRTLRFSLPKGPGVILLGDDESSFALQTSAGPATVTLGRGHVDVAATAVGPGAEAALDAVPRTIGVDDDPDQFSPGTGLLRDVHLRNRGLRLGSTGRVFDALLPAIIGQRVTTEEARNGYRKLVAATSAPAPGDLGLRLPPSPETLGNMSYVDFHGFGLERKRAQIIIEVARRAKRLEEIADMNREDAERRLGAIKGIGPWTAAQAMGSAWGDRDAVPIGDFHLPNTVAWALAKEPRASDVRMLELLQPYIPLRRRALVLIKLSGVHAPRYGPKSQQSAISDSS